MTRSAIRKPIDPRTDRDPTTALHCEIDDRRVSAVCRLHKDIDSCMRPPARARELSASSAFSRQAGGILAIWRARGYRGVLRFLVPHFARTQSDMVFELDLLARANRPLFGKDRKIIVIERHNLINHNLRDIVAQMLEGGAAIHRQGLEKDDLAFVLINRKRRVLNRIFVQFGTRHQTLLGEAAAMPMLTPCRAAPAMRRERLCPKIIRHAGAFLARRGHRRMIIVCDAHNKASVKAILQDGIRQKRAVRSLVLCARFAVQKIIADEAARWRLVVL